MKTNKFNKKGANVPKNLAAEVEEVNINEVVNNEEVATEAAFEANAEAGVTIEKNNINMFGQPIMKTKPAPTGFAALDNIVAAKKDKAEKTVSSEPKAPSAYGIAIESICADPTAKIDDIKKIVEEKTGKEANMVSLKTVFTDVHRVINLLNKNGFTNIK